MAAEFLILSLVTLSSTQIYASGFSTFASNYNAHAINHAVAHPTGGFKVTVPVVSSTPANVGPTIPASVAIPTTSHNPAVGPRTAVTSVTAAPSKPSSSPTPTVAQSPAPPTAASYHIPFYAPAQVAFATSPFGFAAPSKGDFPAASVPFTAAPGYYKGTFYAAASPLYTSSYGIAPAYSPGYAATSHIPAVGPSTAVTSIPAVPSKPNSSSTPAVSQSPASPATATVQVPLAAPAQVAFSASLFGFAAPSKVGFPAASVAFTADPDYNKGPMYADNGPLYDSSYGDVPAYSPAYAANPAFAADPAYFTGPAAFTAGAPVAFSSAPTEPGFTIAPQYNNFVPDAAKTTFAAPSYNPW